MRRKSHATDLSSEEVVKDIRRATRKRYSAEEKIRIVLDGLRGEHSISDAGTAKAMEDYRRIAITPDAVARAIAFAVEQPGDVDVSEIIVRPTASPN